MFSEAAGALADLHQKLGSESGSEVLEGLKKYLRGQNPFEMQERMIPELEPAIDPIIRVDRSMRPSYPDWVEMVMHPELENVGPAGYDITKTEQWLHDGQKGGKWIEGNKIYAHLKEMGDLKNHYTLRDLEEIRKKGIVFFRKYFAGKAVFAWGSIVRAGNGNLRVPFLCEDGVEVVLSWYWTGYRWDSFNPGLRHASDLAKSPSE